MTFVANAALVLGALLIISALENVSLANALQQILAGDTTLTSASNAATGGGAAGGAFSALTPAGASPTPTQGVPL